MANNPFSRRLFLRQTAAGAASAGAVVGVWTADALAKRAGPNDRLRVGLFGAGARGQVHLDTLLKLRDEGAPVDPVAVCDVFSRNRQQAEQKIRGRSPIEPVSSDDYRELLLGADLDLIVVSTPDHWHARMTVEALKAGKHVYCEKPLAHTVEETNQVLDAWRRSGRVMQVGCQRLSDARWSTAREWLDAGRLGKVLHAQTEYFRNSSMGQWRYVGLSRDMSPRHIAWRTFLGVEEGLSPDIPFDRALFAQWRCYWPFSHGVFSELFVHRISELLAATGLGFPRRVVCGGGVFMEYDGRQTPDTATLVADYDEGCQIVCTSTLCNDHPLDVCIRGHHGTVKFDLSKDGFDFLPQRPQITRQRDARPEHVSAAKPTDETTAHWRNFLEAVARNEPQFCNNPPDLGAAATVTALMGAQSYRQGIACEWNPETRSVVASSPAYAEGWERRSRELSSPSHPVGWRADPLLGSRQRSPDYQKLAGPWQGQIDPAG